jgi:ribosomal protein S15P/S13E
MPKEAKEIVANLWERIERLTSHLASTRAKEQRLKGLLNVTLEKLSKKRCEHKGSGEAE